MGSKIPVNYYWTYNFGSRTFYLTFHFSCDIILIEEKEMVNMKNKPRISSSTEATYEADKKTRKFWNVSPITKIIPNKKKNPKIKHKERIGNDYE